MRIFISYASEDVATADALATGLRQDGHTVFFDRDDLRAGEEYNARIRDNVAACDLFVFLITPRSVRTTSYALSELAFARQRWLNPVGHVLPVIAADTPDGDIPPYLKSVTYLKATGNLVATVLARVADIAGERRRRRLILAGAVLAGGACVAAIGTWWLLRPSDHTPCFLSVKVDTGAASASALILDVTYQGRTGSFTVSPDGTAAIQLGPVAAADKRWTLGVRSAAGDIDSTQPLEGCPATARSYALGNGINVTVSPR